MFAKKEAMKIDFRTRAEAFAYMLAYQLEEKKADPMDAAKRADEFANIFAENMGIPNREEPKQEGVDKYIAMADKVVCYCEQHPRAVDAIVGVATFIVGAFAGKKIEQAEERPTQPQPPLDFNNME